jgi:archaellum component FlaC
MHQMSAELNQVKAEIASLKLDCMFKTTDIKTENNQLKKQIKELKFRYKLIPHKLKTMNDALKYRLIKSQINRKKERKF